MPDLRDASSARRCSRPNAPPSAIRRKFRSPWCRRAAASISARSTSSSFRWRIRFRNRMRWRSTPRSAPCCTPATGRSIRRRSSACRPTSGGCASSAMPACWRWSAIPPMRCAKGARPRRPRSPPPSPKLVKAAKGRVAVTTFASNVARLKAVADAAKAAGREVVVVGRAMERVVQVARETGYLDGVQNFRGADLYGHFPPDKVLALCTGSQGEPRAALARIANDDHPQVTLNKGDCVIFSSRTIPGNEKAVGAIINGLVDAGHRGHHRPHPSRPCLRPSAPRRTARHDLLGAPAAPDPRAWRGAASVRARQAGARRRRAEGPDLPQRRPGQARPRRSRHHRRTAVGPALQGRHDPGGFQVARRGRAAARWPLPAAPSSPSP